MTESPKEIAEDLVKVGEKLYCICSNKGKPYVGYVVVTKIEPRYHSKGKYAGRYMGHRITVKGKSETIINLSKTQTIPDEYYRDPIEAVIIRLSQKHHASCGTFFCSYHKKSYAERVAYTENLIAELQDLVNLYKSLQQKG